MITKELNPRYPRYFGQAEKYIDTVFSRFSLLAFNHSDDHAEAIRDKEKSVTLNFFSSILKSVESKFYVYETVDGKKSLVSVIPLQLHDYISARTLKLLTAIRILENIKKRIRKYNGAYNVKELLNVISPKYRPKNENDFLVVLCSLLNIPYLEYIEVISTNRPSASRDLSGFLFTGLITLKDKLYSELEVTIIKDLEQSSGIWHYLNLFEDSHYFKEFNLKSSYSYYNVVTHFKILESLHRLEISFNRMIELLELRKNTTNEEVKNLYGVEFTRMFDLCDNFFKDRGIDIDFGTLTNLASNDRVKEYASLFKKYFDNVERNFINLIPNFYSYKNLQKAFPKELGYYENLFKEKSQNSIERFVAVSSMIELDATKIATFSTNLVGDIQNLLSHSQLDWGETVIQFEEKVSKVGSKTLSSSYFVEKLGSYSSKEGSAMGHCGNQPRASSKDTLYSLRRKVVTKARGREEVGYTVHATITVDGDGVVREAKGKSNKPPAPQFWPYIAKFYLVEDKVKLGTGGFGHWPDETEFPDFNINFIKKSSDFDMNEFAQKPYLFDIASYFEHIGFLKYTKLNDNQFENLFYIHESDAQKAMDSLFRWGYISRESYNLFIDEILKIFKVQELDEIKNKSIVPPLNVNSHYLYVKLFNNLESSNHSDFEYREIGNNYTGNAIDSIRQEIKTIMKKNHELASSVDNQIIKKLREKIGISNKVSLNDVISYFEDYDSKFGFGRVFYLIDEIEENKPLEKWIISKFKKDGSLLSPDLTIRENFILALSVFIKDNFSSVYYGEVEIPFVEIMSDSPDKALAIVNTMIAYEDNFYSKEETIFKIKNYLFAKDAIGNMVSRAVDVYEDIHIKFIISLIAKVFSHITFNSQSTNIIINEAIEDFVTKNFSTKMGYLVSRIISYTYLGQNINHIKHNLIYNLFSTNNIDDLLFNVMMFDKEDERPTLEDSEIRTINYVSEVFTQDIDRSVIINLVKRADGPILRYLETGMRKDGRYEKSKYQEVENLVKFSLAISFAYERLNKIISAIWESIHKFISFNKFGDNLENIHIKNDDFVYLMATPDSFVFSYPQEDQPHLDIKKALKLKSNEEVVFQIQILAESIRNVIQIERFNQTPTTSVREIFRVGFKSLMTLIYTSKILNKNMMKNILFDRPIDGEVSSIKPKLTLEQINRVFDPELLNELFKKTPRYRE